MANINWQNLPSETTPINSTNLNVMSAGLLNVSNEVDDTYRVNLLETKNLFTITSVLPNTALNNNVVFSSSEWDIFVIPVEIGTTYTISKTSYNGGILSFNTTFPKINDTVNNAQTLRNISTLTFEAKDNYLCLMIAKSDDKTTIQVEKGSTATTYEAFVPRSINVDNETFTETIGIGTSVDSRNRVNVLHSHNIYNKNIFNQGNLTSTSTSNRIIGFLKKVTIGDKFTIVNINSNMSFATGICQGNIQGSTGTVTDDSGWKKSQHTITAIQNGYLYLLVKYNDETNLTPSSLNDNDFMINEGSTALPYEPYIIPSIYVDNEEIYSKPTVLWTNPSPTSSFASQTINIGNYYKLDVIFKRHTAETNQIVIPVYNDGNFNQAIGIYNNKLVLRQTSYTNNSLYLAGGNIFDTYGTPTSNDSVMIPIKVIGYK